MPHDLHGSQVPLAIAWKLMFNPAYRLSASHAGLLGPSRLD
jgi:hypothetical protein